jgi:L,D-peptidoglycan transpeptidase YkuD (ErfK/YbiS/YcfS/YnhG family)
MPGIMRAMLLALVVLIAPQAAQAQNCLAVIDSATRLALVVAGNMQTSAAMLTLYSRERRSAPWRPLGAAQPVRLGENGIAWGAGFTQLARGAEPVKNERDRRTPAGIFRIGAPFGFGTSKLPHYLQIKAGETFCVDDMKSPAYNTITTIARAGRHVTGERMHNFPGYRHGLFIDYPSNYSKPLGSCIFIHIWDAPGEATAGCVAMPEARVVQLQDFAASGAVIAVLPRGALDRFKGCLP